MKAPGRIEIEERPLPQPRGDWAVVRTLAASICASDFHTAFEPSSHEPDILGHEAIGLIEEDPTGRFAPGEMVLAVPQPEFGRTFAQYQAVPTGYLVPVPATADPASVLLAQQLGTVVFALRSFLRDRTPRSAVVIGCGPAGLNFVQLLRHRGCEQIIAVDPLAWRREAALRLGAAEAVDPAKADVVGAVREITGGAGVDLAVEAVGRNETRSQAVAAAGVEGVVGFFGLPDWQVPELVLPFDEVFRKSLTLASCQNTQDEPGLRSFREAIDLLDGGALRGRELFSHVFGLDDVQRAFEAARYPYESVLKVAVGIDAAVATTA